MRREYRYLGSLYSQFASDSAIIFCVAMIFLSINIPNSLVHTRPATHLTKPPCYLEIWSSSCRVLIKLFLVQSCHY